MKMPGNGFLSPLFKRVRLTPAFIVASQAGTAIRRSSICDHVVIYAVCYSGMVFSLRSGHLIVLPLM